MKIDTKKRNRKIINNKNYTVIKYKHSILTSQKIGNLVIPNSSMKVELIQKEDYYTQIFLVVLNMKIHLLKKHYQPQKRKLKLKNCLIPNQKTFMEQ